MRLTAAAIIRLANTPPEVRRKLLPDDANHKAVIAKCRELMSVSPVDQEQNRKLDELIGECSLPAAKQRHGDKMELS